MITEEEKTEIIEAAVEKALLKLPEVVGNLMANHAMLAEFNSKFYKDHPEFKDKKEIVASVVEHVESKNPNLEYEDILKKAVPEIRKRIETVGNMDVETISTPKKDTKYPDLGDL